MAERAVLFLFAISGRLPGRSVPYSGKGVDGVGTEDFWEGLCGSSEDVDIWCCLSDEDEPGSSEIMYGLISGCCGSGAGSNKVRSGWVADQENDRKAGRNL